MIHAYYTRLGYGITGYLNKETSSDTEINPILVEDRDDLAGPNEISLDEERIHLTNLVLMDHKIKEPPQLKEGSTSVNDLLGAFYTIRSRADRHHDLFEGIPQWGGECSYPKVLNMTTHNKSSNSQKRPHIVRQDGCIVECAMNLSRFKVSVATVVT